MDGMAEPPPRGKQDFATMRQEMMTRLHTELACVESAKDEAALRACRPKPPQGGRDGRSAPGMPNGADDHRDGLPDF